MKYIKNLKNNPLRMGLIINSTQKRKNTRLKKTLSEGVHCHYQECKCKLKQFLRFLSFQIRIAKVKQTNKKMLVVLWEKRNFQQYC